MPLHHYLPASFLARFSQDKVRLPRRLRQVLAGFKDESRIFPISAENAAAVKNLYALAASRDDPALVEKTWSEFEKDLTEAIDLLIAGRIDARSWIRVLVPFVAAMLVRGPDFNLRFERRIRALGLDPDTGIISQDNTNGARLLELQRLLGPVAVAKWTVLHVIGQEPLITNDLGYAPFRNALTGDIGIAIPLDPMYVLAISPRTQREVLRSQSGEWLPVIEYFDNAPNNHEDLNKALSSIAQHFIFGPDEGTVRKYLPSGDEAIRPPEPEQIGFITDPLARAHEFTWHRLAALIEKDPRDDDSWCFPLGWRLVKKGWVPPIFFPTNLVEFPPALKRVDGSVLAEFYDPQVYYSLSLIRQLEQMGDFDSLLEEAEKGIHLAAEDEHRVRFLVAKASALDEKGKYGDALNAYAEALTLDPKCAVATLNRGVTLLKMGQSDAALESFDQALSLDPGLSLAHVNRAGVLASAGDYASAIDELTEALRSLPPGPVRALALLSRGTSLAGLGKNRDALADLDDAFLEYRDPLAKSRCLFHKAIAHKDLADQTSAMAAIDAAIELHNEAPAFHLLRAELLLRDEELETASSSVARALSLNPSAGMAAQAHDFLARIQTEGGNLPEALTENDKAIALDPENASLHHNRGLTLLQQGRLRDATVSFTDALHRDQGNAGAWNNRGIARGAQGDYTGAMADYEKAVEVAVDPHDTGSSLRHLAQCHLLIGEAAEAECCLERARASDPDSPFNLVIEGLILLYRGEFDNSLSLRADAAGEEDAPDIQIYMSLPIILLGEIEKGVEIAERHWQELGALVTRNEFMNHARALCTMFRTQKALDALLEVEAKT